MLAEAVKRCCHVLWQQCWLAKWCEAHLNRACVYCRQNVYKLSVENWEIWESEWSWPRHWGALDVALVFVLFLFWAPHKQRNWKGRKQQSVAPFGNAFLLWIIWPEADSRRLHRRMAPTYWFAPPFQLSLWHKDAASEREGNTDAQQRRSSVRVWLCQSSVVFLLFLSLCPLFVGRVMWSASWHLLAMPTTCVFQLDRLNPVYNSGEYISGRILLRTDKVKRVNGACCPHFQYQLAKTSSQFPSLQPSMLLWKARPRCNGPWAARVRRRTIRATSSIYTHAPMSSTTRCSVPGCMFMCWHCVYHPTAQAAARVRMAI